MYLDFDDHRPETPSVPPVISRREGVLLSLVFHLSLTIVYLLTPEGLFKSEVVPVPSQPSQDNVQFVMMEPLMERPVTPPPQAEASDLDRRATSRERPPNPENAAPFSRGNTPEKVVGAPSGEPPKGDNGTAPPSPDPPPPSPDAPSIVATDPTPAPRAGGRGSPTPSRICPSFCSRTILRTTVGGSPSRMPRSASTPRASILGGGCDGL